MKADSVAYSNVDYKVFNLIKIFFFKVYFISSYLYLGNSTLETELCC